MDTEELTGRGDLLQTLFDAVNSPVDHREAILLVGEAGVGKTACLRAVARMSRSAGHQLLATTGTDAETDLPFAGLHRLLGPLLPRVTALPDVQRRALLGALGLGDEGPADRFVVAVATLTLVRDAAEERPLVITADDVQSLDEQTRHVLAFVARRIEKSHVPVVATSSSPQRRADLCDAFREVHLARLDDAAAHRLLTGRAPGLDRHQREWVVGQAAGNPLALVELSRTPAAVLKRTSPLGPSLTLNAALVQAFTRHWSELSAASKDAVLVAALDPDASLQEILAATALLSGGAVTTAVLEIPQSLGLLSFHETRVRFSHPLVMAAIAQRESVSRTQTAHRALGAVIAVNSQRRAWHRALGSATHDDAIATELEASTSDRRHRVDPEVAIMALERAAQLSTEPVERGRRLLLAAGHAIRLGQADVAIRLLGAASSGPLSAEDGIRAELLREDFEGTATGDSARVIQLGQLARRAAGAGDSDFALDVAVAAVRRRCAAPLDGPARSELVALAQSLARSSDDARTLVVLALADPIGHGRAVLTELAGITERTDIGSDVLGAYATAARAVGHYSWALSLFDRAEIELRDRGLFGTLARNLCVAADIRLELGEWDRATAGLSEFATLNAASMSANHRVGAQVATAKAAALCGDPSAALEMVSAAVHSRAARAGSRYLAQAQIVLGIAHIAAGRHLDACIALRRVFEPDDPTSHFREQFGAVTYLAEAASRCGRQDDARQVIGRLRWVAAVSGSPLLLTHLAYADAVLAPDDTAEAMFLAGLAADASCAPWPRARLQLAYGRWLRRQQRVTQSRGPLRASVTTLQRLGAARWAEEAQDELKAAGAQGQDRNSGAAGLSAQESKIAQLAAAGLTNKEIAQQLYLSPRTVSSHLYRIFPKLGVLTRGQLAARLEEPSRID